MISSVTPEEGRPLSIDEFSQRVEALGPFEAAPHVAVAVSGGRDSMALCLLINQWVRGWGGRLSALTVDHRLRPESAAETKQIESWLSRHGIDHHVLTWRGPKPATGIQAAARDARYALMEQWCQNAGVLHLFLAHHQEDQAETVLFRLRHDSGLDGLAGMSCIRERSYMRLLRPLLDVPRCRLTALLQHEGQEWLEDPSNLDPKYARTRLRDELENSTELSVDHLTALAQRCARARMALEQDAAYLLAQSCSVDPAGFVRLDLLKMAAAPEEISLRVLSRAIRCIGGRIHGPRQAPLERLHGLIHSTDFARSRTLGGCHILRRGPEILVMREFRNTPEPVMMASEQTFLWDNRFLVALDGQFKNTCGSVWLAALGRDGWQGIKAGMDPLQGRNLPAAVKHTLPAIYDYHGVALVPHLDFVRDDWVSAPQNGLKAAFCPPQGLADNGFVGFMLHKQGDILSL